MNDEPQMEADIAHEDAERFKHIASKHGKFIVFAIAVVLLAAAAGGLHRRRMVAKADEAIQLLTESRTTKDLETLVAEHGGSPLVPIALIRMAKLYYDSGNYNVALSKYDEFVENYPDHAMTTAAVLGKIQCMEARGQVQDAMRDYVAFAKERPEHYLTPQAVLGHARCLEQLGSLEEARQTCSDFIEANPESSWVLLAEEMVERLGKKIARMERQQKQAAVGSAVQTAE